MAGKFKEAESNIELVLEIVDEASEAGQIEVFITGEATFSQDFVDGNQADAESGEAFGVPIALIILAVVFGALAAAVLPVILAVVSIVVAFGAVLLIGQVIQVQAFAQNLITMIGLAVGIDYSLFIVSRFREERARGLAKLDAISAAGRTASRTVFFSGMTVVFAVLGVLIVPDRVYFSVGLGMIVVVTIAVLGVLIVPDRVYFSVGLGMIVVVTIAVLGVTYASPGGAEPNRRPGQQVPGPAGGQAPDAVCRSGGRFLGHGDPYRHAPASRQPRLDGRAPHRGDGAILLHQYRNLGSQRATG